MAIAGGALPLYYPRLAQNTALTHCPAHVRVRPVTGAAGYFGDVACFWPAVLLHQLLHHCIDFDTLIATGMALGETIMKCHSSCEHFVKPALIRFPFLIVPKERNHLLFLHFSHHIELIL